MNARIWHWTPQHTWRNSWRIILNSDSSLKFSEPILNEIRKINPVQMRGEISGSINRNIPD